MCVVATTASGSTVVVGRPDLSGGVAAGTCDSTTPCAWFGVINTALSTPGAILSVPADGTVTGWRVRATKSGTASAVLHAVRQSGGQLLGIGSSPLAAATDGITENPLAIPVHVGDQFSVTYEAFHGVGAVTAFDITAAGGALAGLAIVSDGGTGSPQSPVANRESLYNATVALEPPGISLLNPGSGATAGGTAVTITGAHLAITSGVTFGGVPASILAADNTSITVVAPPHAAGVVPVLVATAGGTTVATQPSLFTYVGPPDTTKPVIRSMSLAPSVFRAGNLGGPVTTSRIGSRVLVRLSEAARVRFTVFRVLPGRRVSHRCLQPTSARRARAACRRLVAVPGAFSRSGVAGVNRFTFTGRPGGRALRAGAYQLRAVATDAAGNRSSPVSKGFRVVLV